MRSGRAVLRRRSVGLLILTASLIQAQPSAEDRPPPGPRDVRVSFVDVGQGDAIWIQIPSGTGQQPKNILIDGGPDRGKKNRLITYLNTYGLHGGDLIDVLIVTHPHDDHYPGLLDVLAQYQVRTIIDSGYPKPGKYQEFLRAARAETVNGRPSTLINLRNTPDLKLDWGPAVNARILHTDAAKGPPMGTGNTRENNASTVVRLEVGHTSFLLMGDAEGKERSNPATTCKFVEKLLLDKFTSRDLHATVLKAGHHGSETGSTLPFLKAVHPDVVVVMSGRKAFNGTFIPDEAVLRRYQKENDKVRIFRTDDQDEAEGHTTKDDADGDDIYMLTDGKTLRVYQALGQDFKRTWRRVAIIQ